MRGAINFFDIAGAENPRVKMIVINDAGHYVFRERPDQFNADLIQFIESSNNNASSPRPH
jgi:pimeloyl-ACP methyl ester carboxylesterase